MSLPKTAKTSFRTDCPLGVKIQLSMNVDFFSEIWIIK
jgi:hypothetical protein